MNCLFRTGVLNFTNLLLAKKKSAGGGGLKNGRDSIGRRLG